MSKLPTKGEIEDSTDLGNVEAEIEIECYEHTTQKIYEAKAVIDGLNDVKTGRMVDGEKAISAVREKYSI